MTLIYCAHDKREKVRRSLSVEGPYQFASPASTGVCHWAGRVIVVGNHPSIEKRYRGITRVETLSLEPEPETDPAE